MHFLKIWKVISPFLNFDSSTGDFLKNAKISLVLLIGPFLIRTDCVYCHAIKKWHELLSRWTLIFNVLGAGWPGLDFYIMSSD